MRISNAGHLERRPQDDGDIVVPLGSGCADVGQKLLDFGAQIL